MLHGIRDRGAHDRGPRHGVERVPRHDRLWGGTGERRLTDEHLVQHARQTVLIAAAVNLLASRGLLRAHVGRRPDDRSRLCERLRLPRDAEGTGDLEVRDDRGPARKQDVLRLDVAVHHAVAVRVGQRSRHLRRDAHGVLEPQLLFPVQAVAERFPLHVGHHVVEKAPGRAGVVQRENVRMLQPSRDLDLAQKPLRTHRGRKLGVQHLDGDRTAVFQVLGEKHRRHTAAAQLPLDGVEPGERVTEGFEEVGHEGGAPGENGSVAYTAAQPPARTGPDSFQTERAALGYKARP